ncbi:MAG: hypothetical protein K6360_06685 [Deltaproteobacteria bacterium]
MPGYVKPFSCVLARTIVRALTLFVLVTLSTYASIHAQESPAIAPNVSLEFPDFPDLPTPIEIKKVDDECSILKTVGGFRAGRLVMRGRVDEASLVAFFEKTMPKYGWANKGSIESRKSILIFSKEPGSFCMIRIIPKRFGLATDVEIWIVSSGSREFS